MVEDARPRKIGIVGGVGWPSTALYYTEISRRSQALACCTGLSGVPSTPEMSIESLDLRRAVSLIGTDPDESSWAGFDDDHRVALRRLEASGATFAVIASNTPHHRYAAIVRDLALPVIDMFDVVAKRCAASRRRQMFVLGTTLTMGSQRLRSAFAARGIAADAPADARDRAASVALIEELEHGRDERAAERIGNLVHAAGVCAVSSPTALRP